jgi:hypothetical protein
MALIAAVNRCDSDAVTLPNAVLTFSFSNYLSAGTMAAVLARRDRRRKIPVHLCQLFKVRLSKGKNVLTLHIVTNGNMNLAYFESKEVHE